MPHSTLEWTNFLSMLPSILSYANVITLTRFRRINREMYQLIGGDHQQHTIYQHLKIRLQLSYLPRLPKWLLNHIQDLVLVGPMPERSKNDVESSSSSVSVATRLSPHSLKQLRGLSLESIRLNLPLQQFLGLLESDGRTLHPLSHLSSLTIDPYCQCDWDAHSLKEQDEVGQAQNQYDLRLVCQAFNLTHLTVLDLPFQFEPIPDRALATAFLSYIQENSTSSGSRLRDLHCTSQELESSVDFLSSLQSLDCLLLKGSSLTALTNRYLQFHELTSLSLTATTDSLQLLQSLSAGIKAGDLHRLRDLSLSIQTKGIHDVEPIWLELNDLKHLLVKLCVTLPFLLNLLPAMRRPGAGSVRSIRPHLFPRLKSLTLDHASCSLFGNQREIFQKPYHPDDTPQPPDSVLTHFSCIGPAESPTYFEYFAALFTRIFIHNQFTHLGWINSHQLYQSNRIMGPWIPTPTADIATASTAADPPPSIAHRISDGMIKLMNRFHSLTQLSLFLTRIPNEEHATLIRDRTSSSMKHMTRVPENVYELLVNIHYFFPQLTHFELNTRDRDMQPECTLAHWTRLSQIGQFGHWTSLRLHTLCWPLEPLLLFLRSQPDLHLHQHLITPNITWPIEPEVVRFEEFKLFHHMSSSDHTLVDPWSGVSWRVTIKIKEPLIPAVIGAI